MIFDWKTELHRYRYYFVNLKTISKRRDVSSFAELTATFLVISFFILFAIRPTFVIIARLMREIRDQQEVSEKLQKKIVALRMAQEEFSNNMNRLYLVDQALPEKPDFPLLIFAVEKEAQETDTQIQSLSVTKISVKAGEEVQPKAAPVSFFDFNLILTGDYQNLKGFLGRMENLRRIVKLDSISFEKAKKTEKELPKIKLSVTGRANFHPQEISL